jgi:hypothetical protein
MFYNFKTFTLTLMYSKEKYELFLFLEISFIFYILKHLNYY